MATYEPGIWERSTAGFPAGNVPEGLPSDYLAAIALLGPGEGPIGTSYLRLYPVEELTALNEAYAVSEFYPGLTIFGSNGGGEAYAFKDGTPPSVVRVPFIPLSPALAVSVGGSFSELIHALNEEGEAEPGINSSLLGLEIHEVKPVALGGSPTDPENKVYLAPPKHAELCVFWNRLYRRLEAERGT
jgi:hypothetical protein